MSDVFGSLSFDSLPSGYGQDDSSNAVMPTLTQSPPELSIPGTWSSGAASTVPIQQGVPDGLSFDMYEEGAEEVTQGAAKANPQKPAPLSPDIERSLFFKALQSHTPRPPARANPDITVSSLVKRDPNATVFADSGGYVWDINPDGSVLSLNKETVNKRFPAGSTVAQAVLGQAKAQGVGMPKVKPAGAAPATAVPTDSKKISQIGKKKGKKGKKGGKKKAASSRGSGAGRSTAAEVAEVLAPVAAAAVGIEMPVDDPGLEDTSMEEYDESYEEEEDEGMGIGAKIALTLGFFALCGAGYYFYQKRQAANASS